MHKQELSREQTQRNEALLTMLVKANPTNTAITITLTPRRPRIGACTSCREIKYMGVTIDNRFAYVSIGFHGLLM